MFKAYSKSVFPAMLAFAFSGVYSIVDGLFVGNCVGDVGVSAINVAWPLVVLVQALGTGIGMSGAVNLSISKAAGDEESERRYRCIIALSMRRIFSGVPKVERPTA